MIFTCRGAVALGIMCLAILTPQHAAAGGVKASGRKCAASDSLTCTASSFYTAPDLSLALTNPNIPDLTVLDFEPVTDLRTILPYNDAIKLLYTQLPESYRNCKEPALTSSEALSLASSGRPWAKAAGMSACEAAPMFTGAKHSPYYIFGAMPELSSLPKSKDIKGLPALANLRAKYTRMAPRLSMCVALDPCQLNVFLGLHGMTKHVVVSGQGVSLAVKPTRFFYSWSVTVPPVDWRSPKAPPVFWQVDPALTSSPGEEIPVETLSIPRGRTFLQGLSSKGKGASMASLPSAVLDLGGQPWAWVMFRDEQFLSVSLRLAVAPPVKLWSKFELPLQRSGFKGIDLLTRRPTDQFWMRAPGQNVSAQAFIKNVPSLGNLLKRVYSGADVNKAVRITQFDMYLAGSKGAALRLQLGPSRFVMTPNVSAVTGDKLVVGPMTVIATVGVNGPRLANHVTLAYGNKTHHIRFCASTSECDAAQYSRCDAALKVCIPGSRTDGQECDKGKGKDCGTNGGGDEKKSPPPPPPVVSPYKLGSQLVGDPCLSANDCAHPLNCAVDRTLKLKVCSEKSG